MGSADVEDGVQEAIHPFEWLLKDRLFFQCKHFAGSEMMQKHSVQEDLALIFLGSKMLKPGNDLLGF